jgi:hypothetical protein
MNAHLNMQMSGWMESGKGLPKICLFRFGSPYGIKNLTLALNLNTFPFALKFLTFTHDCISNAMHLSSLASNTQ